MFEHRRIDRPKARRERLVAQRVGDELVVYDSLTHQAHCLAPDAVEVWELADGERTTTEIGDALGRDTAEVQRAVDELGRIALLEDPVPIGLSRREAAKRIAKVGGAAFAAPLIYSVAVPMAAAAASCIATGTSSGSCSGGTNAACCTGCCTPGVKKCALCGSGQPCTQGGQCSSGVCNSTTHTCS